MSDEGIHHVVQPGDCIACIAMGSGHFPDTIWNHAENAALKESRGDPNVLFSGDEVFVPALRPKEESRASDAKHRFKRKGVPAKLNFQLVFNGKPRANIPYHLVIDGVGRDGQTDGDGWVRESIPPNAGTARLTLRPSGKPEEVLEFQLGHLDPIDTVEGQKGRLRNLGFFGEEIDDTISEEFTAAILAFQKKMGLSESGEADEETRSRLKSKHQS